MNNQKPINEEPQPNTPPPQPNQFQSAQSPLQRWLPAIVGVAIVVLAGGGVFAYQAWWSGPSEPPTQESPIGTTPGEFLKAGERVEDKTANWKTYRNEEYGFEVKYPSGWSIDGREFKLYTEADSFALTIENKKIYENPRVEMYLNPGGVGYEFLKRTKAESIVIGKQAVEFIYAQSEEDPVFRCGEKGVKTLRGFLDAKLNEYGHRDAWFLWGIFCQEGEDYTAVLEQILSTFKFIEADETAN